MIEFSPIADSYFLVAMIVGALVVLLALIGPDRERAGPGRRIALAALRVGVIAAVLWMMLRPQRTIVRMEEQPATLAILADVSRSMTVEDETGERTRWDMLVEQLRAAEPALRDLPKRVEVHAYTFDGDVRKVSVKDGRIQLPLIPEGEQTAIGKALMRVARDEAGQRLLGVIMLSDGAQRAYPPNDTPPQSAAVALRHGAAPLYTIPFGQSRARAATRDVAIESLLASESVFVNNQLPVSAEIRVDGYDGRPVKVRLLAEIQAADAPVDNGSKMQVIDETTVIATPTRRMLPVRFNLTPDTVGELKLTVEVEAQQNELVTTNNSQSTFVRVLGGGLRVLYVEGTPRVESRFIRKSIAASPDIHVDFLRIDPRNRNTFPPDWNTRLTSGEYEAIILGDVDSSAFSKEQLQALADAIDRGLGLIMIGGMHTFGPGGYNDTPLAPVIPFEMNSLERQQLDGKIREDVHIQKMLRPLPTENGLRVPSLNLGPDRDETLKIWRSLPPLEGANKFGRNRPSAPVLLADGDIPLMVGQNWGGGRVLAFAGDTTWRWWLHGFEKTHKRFWRQTILFLAKKKLAEKGEVWVKTARRRYSPGETVELLAGMTGTTVGDGSTRFEAQVILPDGTKRPLSMIERDDTMTAAIRGVTMPGDYTVVVTARQGQTVLGDARARFLVRSEDLELDNASADIGLLESLATATDGRSLPPEDLPGLLNELAEKAETLKIPHQHRIDYYDKGWLLMLIVLLLSVEWYLRKSWGLV